MFRISDIEFRVVDANLDAYVDDDETKIVWGIEVCGAAIEKEFERWKPSVKLDGLRSTVPGELKHWRDLAETSKNWSEKYDENGEEIAILYVFGHEPIYESHIQLIPHPKGLGVKWEGLCDIHWNDEYGQELEFRIDTPISFSGIWCGREPVAACLPALQRFFPADDYQYTQTKNGVSIFIPVN